MAAAIVRCVDHQTPQPPTVGPRHRAPGTGPDDERLPPARRRVDAAPLADPAWLGRLRADARSTGRAGPPRVGAHPTRMGVATSRPGRPGARTGLSRGRAAAGPLVALTVVIAATVAVLGAVDRGGRGGSTGPAAVMAVSASAPVSAAPTVSAPVTGPDRESQPARSVVAPPPVPARPAPVASAPVPSAPGPAPVPSAPTVDRGTGSPRVLVTGSPVEVLEALQRIRSTAFSTGRLGLLGAVYPPGSGLATSDRAAHTRLVPTGGTVAGLAFDLRETTVAERTPVRVVVTALVRQRAVEVVSGTSVRRLPGRELGRLRVVLGRASVTAPWVITASTRVDPP